MTKCEWKVGDGNVGATQAKGKGIGNGNGTEGMGKT